LPVSQAIAGTKSCGLDRRKTDKKGKKPVGVAFFFHPTWNVWFTGFFGVDMARLAVHLRHILRGCSYRFMPNGGGA
jgi:hypothetical protein